MRRGGRKNGEKGDIMGEWFNEKFMGCGDDWCGNERESWIKYDIRATGWVAWRVL